MKTSPPPRLSLSLILITTIVSLTCLEAKAQSSIVEKLFHGGTYENASERQALYTSNAERPLGGLFAPGFTRTLTVLGGANYPSDGVLENDFVSILPASGLSPLSERSIDDSGYAISFAFGRRHSHKLRSEIEVAFRSNDINQLSNTSISGNNLGVIQPQEDGSVNATSIMKNFIREFNNNSLFTPYVGAGLGLSYIDVEFGEANSSDGEATFQNGEAIFSYQAIGGVATKLNSWSDFIIEYRFLGTSEIEFGSLNDSFAYNTSTLFLGATFEY